MARDFTVSMIYWGDSFISAPSPANPAAGPFSWAAMDGAVNLLCRGPYFNGLRQYGLGSVTEGQFYVLHDDPPAGWRDGTQDHGFPDKAIQDRIIGEISLGNVMEPGDFPDGHTPIYVVVLPQGLYSKDHFLTAVGLHSSLDYSGSRGLWAWVMQGESLDDTTKGVAHEVVEAIASELGAGEVGDLCVRYTGLVDDVMVQGYTSAADQGRCIIPGIPIVQFQSVNFTSRYIRHRNFLGELEEVAVGQEKDFGFRILTSGRDGAGLQRITLQPVNFPDDRFRFGPPDFRVRLVDPEVQWGSPGTLGGGGTSGHDSTAIFGAEPLFYLRPGLASPTDPNAVSFQSIGDPNSWLRHRDFHLWVEPRSNPDFDKDATFIKTVFVD